MIYQPINIGTTANDGTGDSLRTAFGKINQNMATLWSASLPSGPDGAIQYRGTATLSDIAYLGGVWVTVGATERILSSVDLVTWAAVSAPATTTVHSIITDGTQWIAVGDGGLIMTSPDGATWTLRTSGATQNLNSIATDGTYLVALGDAGTILRSTDGVTWVTIPSPVTVNLNAVDYNATLLAWTAVGDGGTIISSTDSASWNESVSGTVNNLNAVTHYLNTVVIAGDGGTILASQDLVNWGTRTSGTTASLRGVTTAVWGTSILAFAVGDSGTIITSADAGFITWGTTDYPSITTSNLLGVVADNGMVIATGDGGTLIVADGNNTWTDSGISIGIEGDSSLVFDPTTNLLSIDANIIPQTSNAWSLGNATNRFEQAYFGAAGVTISGVAVTANTDTLQIVSAANTANLANLQVSVITAENFVGNASGLTGLTVKASAPAFGVQWADANLDLISSSNLTFDDTISTLTTGNIIADTVTATTLTGDGGNITGLPVAAIVAGTNVTVANSGGTWTISASGGGGNGNVVTNSSHLPVNSIQLAAADGSFNSDPALTFDPSTSILTLAGNLAAQNGSFSGNITSQNSTISGNLTAGNISITGNINLNAQSANSANLGNIRIWRSNIHEFGSGNDDFVIDTERANLVIQGANSTVLNANALAITIRGGNVVGNGTGSLVTVVGGSGGLSGNGGGLVLAGGTGGTDGNGGNVDIRGGNSTTGGDGGTINIISGVTYGDPTTIHGANLYLQSGNTINEDAGTLIIQGGNAVGTNLYGGNIRITAGTGSIGNGRISIGNIRWPDAFGLNNQVLTTDGLGNAIWASVNANTPANLIVSNLVNGTSNVQVATSGNVTFGISGVANVATVTATGIRTNTVTTNALILGDSTSTAVTTRWVKASTVNAAADQILWQAPAGLQVSTDFKIITYDVPASNRQSSQITSVTYGTSTSYSEYARTVINTVIADFSVDQLGGNIRLLVSPRVAHLINYTIIVSTY